MVNKRVFIIHGFRGNPEGGWKPWLKKELEEKGFLVTVPSMPSPGRPKMNEWVGKITETVGKPDEKCYLIGHSLGCIAILRYLETLKGEERVGKVFLVAGSAYGRGVEEFKTFYQNPIDWDLIKSRSKNFVAINSDNDPYVPLKQGYILGEKLGAKLIIGYGMKHFSSGDGFTELPLLLDQIIED